MSLDELIDFDINIEEIQEAINKTSEETEEKINWTNAWEKNTLFFLDIRQMLIFLIMLIRLT